MSLDLAFLSAVFKSFPEPVLLVQGDGTVLYCNTSATQRFLGLSAGMPCPKALTEVLGMELGAMVLVRSIDGQDCRISVTPVEGERLMVLRPVPGSGRKAQLHTSMLTGQLRQQIANLSAAEQQLEQKLREAEQVNPDQYLARIHQSVHRLMCAINELELDQALNRDAEPVFSTTPLDLAGLCLQLEREVMPLAQQENMEFQVDTELSSLITTGDEKLLRQMLLSLISNAMKAAGSGGRLGLKLAKSRGRAIIKVWDSGAGMSAGRLATVFQEEEPNAIPLPRQGLGLGLTLAQRIAALHDGVLMLESQETLGVRVTVSLPIQTPKGLPLYSTNLYKSDPYGGFSPLLVELSDALSWRAFLPKDLE